MAVTTYSDKERVHEPESEKRRGHKSCNAIFACHTSVSLCKCAIFIVPHASQSRLDRIIDNDLPASADRDPTRDSPARRS